VGVRPERIRENTETILDCFGGGQA
jgi:hypothetical protein